MVTASNLLTAFMLGGWLAVTPAAMAASPEGIQNKIVQQAHAFAGEARTAGVIPTVRSYQRKWNRQVATFDRRVQAQRNYAYRVTAHRAPLRQRQLAQGGSFSNLNQ